jgi:outer membrane protein OmpA-like peptidoglycan-associated protein
MKSGMQVISVGILAVLLIFGTASLAQEKSGNSITQIESGQKMKVSGLIVSRDAGGFVLRSGGGWDVAVKLTPATSIKEKKANPFRDSRAYLPEQLVRGLNVEVEGIGDAGGALSAKSVKFTETEHRIASSVESRVTPLEGRMSDNEGRLTRSEENARHLSGQVEELREVASAARGGAKTAQETADSAVSGVNAANERIASVDQATNARITAMDDYAVRNSMVVHFKLGSNTLTPEAKVQLDQLTREAQAQKGYVIEVTGFASSDGNEAYNRVLSQRRADAVVQYLADNLIPLRRIVTPYGFGEKMPAADNTTRAGREENRRVEVKILVSQGIAGGESRGSVADRTQK